MKKTKLYYLIIILFVVTLVAIFIQNQKQKTNDQNFNDQNLKVVYLFGSGWTGMSRTLTISNDGSVILENQEPFNGNKTKKSIQLSSVELQELKTLIINANVFGYEDDYSCKSNCPTDAPGASIEFTLNNNVKTVSWSAPRGMPASLEQILDEINAIEDKFQ